MRCIAPFPSTAIWHLEEVLYDLPPLEGVFLHWHTHGVTATTAGMVSLLARRKQLLGQTTLSRGSIQLLYECATDCLSTLPTEASCSAWERRPFHARLLRHAASLSPAQTQKLLPPGVLVQKTVSITLADTSMLCTSVGLHGLTRQQVRAITAALVRPKCSIKQYESIASTCRPGEAFAMHPAIVSPFLHPSHNTGLTALVQLP